MFHIKKCDKIELKKMISDYYDYVTAPMDDMWENGIIANANFNMIKNNNDKIGYFVVDKDNIMLQFYVVDSFKLVSDEVFKFVIKEVGIKAAYVSTYDFNFINHCFDNQRSVEVNTFLYKDMTAVEMINPLEETQFIVADISELIEILDYHNKKVNLSGEWLESYCRDIISRGELYLLKYKGTIVGTGELRPSFSSPNYANLGVTVSKDYQGIGLGTYIITYMKNLSYIKNLKPICSTSSTNYASQKVITKSGFYPYHRVLKILFD